MKEKPRRSYEERMARMEGEWRNNRFGVDETSSASGRREPTVLFDESAARREWLYNRTGIDDREV